MDTKEKLELLGKHMAEQILKGESPTFRTRVRSRSNILLKDGSLTLGDRWEERKFLNISQAKSFMQTIAVASKLKSFLEQGLHTSIRGLYYQLKFSLGEDLDENLFDEQSESNALVEDLEAALGVKREDFNLTTDRKGVLAGPIKIIDRFGGDEVIIDGTKMGRSGWMIPSDVDKDMEIKEIDAEYVLVVEKDALWQRLNEDRFWEKEKAILITPKGQSSRGTRRLLRKLADMGLPIYVFSVVGDETILIYRNGNLEVKTLEELEKEGKDEVNDGHAIRKTLDVYSWGVKKDGTVEQGKISYIVKHKTSEIITLINEETGKTLRVTPEHSLIVFNSRTFEIVEKKPDELTHWDYLLVYYPENYEHVSSIGTIKLNKETMFILGLYLAKHVKNYKVLKDLLDKKGIKYSAKGRYLRIEWPEWVSHIKEFPKEILNAPYKEEFLMGLLLAQGRPLLNGLHIVHDNLKELEIMFHQSAIEVNYMDNGLFIKANREQVAKKKFPRVKFPKNFLKSIEEIIYLKYRKKLSVLEKLDIGELSKKVKEAKTSRIYSDLIEGRVRKALIEKKLQTSRGNMTNKAKNLIHKLSLIENLVANRLVPRKFKARANNKKSYWVYDVSLPGIGTFFASNIAVHNTDCDAWGWYIYWTLKTGSINLAYLGKEFTVPEAKFIGVTMSDIERYPFLKKLTIKAKDVDLKRAQEMLNYEWINKYPEWVKELELVLKTKKKLEQDALQGQRLTFVGEYVRDKIKNQEFLP